MILSCEGNTYFAISRYDDREVLKQAGFRWNRDLKRWETADPAVASRLIKCADDHARALLADTARTREESIKASKSVSSDFNPPCPDGLSYLPFQKAGIAYGLTRRGVLFGDEMGCVDGEAVIHINRGGVGRKHLLASAYKRFHGLDQTNYNWDKNIPTYTRSLCGTELRLNKVIDILDKGIRPVMRLTLASGKFLRLTPDHEIGTGINQWTMVQNLRTEDVVLANGELRCLRCGSNDRVVTYYRAKFKGYCRRCMYRYFRTNSHWKTGKHLDKTGYVMISRQWDHPKHDLTGAVREHVLVMEAYLGRYLLPGEIVHHKDENKQNNQLDNLEIHTRGSHQRYHGHKSSYKNMHGGVAGKGGEICFFPKNDSVVSVVPDGEAHVYDVVCEDPHRNFIANGIIVHNCGKTVEALGMINALPESETKRILVICPASLKINWARESRRWLVQPREVAIAESKNFPRSDFVICNYDILKKHHDTICAAPWDILIADEVHFLKSSRAIRTLEVLGGREKKKEGEKHGVKHDPIPARRRIFLTGTPILNRPIEIWSIAHALAPGEFPDFWKFTQRYCDSHNSGFGWDMSGASHLDELQLKLRASCMIRRLKSEVMTELPPKRRSIIPVAPEGCEGVVQAEKAAYDRHIERTADLRARVELAKASEDYGDYEQAVAGLKEANQVAFTEMALLRHDTARAKVPFVVEHIKACLEEVGKLVVFAHHHDVIDALCEGAGWGQVVKLTGEMKIEDRQQAVDRFQKDPSCKVFVGSIKAAGLGITLTAASHVIFAELDWVPASITQAEDRCLIKGSLVFCLRSVYANGMGIVGIENIKIGDTVLSHLGREKRVIDIGNHEHRGLITSVHYMGWPEPLVCTHDHKVLIKRKEKMLWIQAHQLLPTDSMVFPKINNYSRLEKIKIADKWRIYLSVQKPKICTIPGCENQIEARGMCTIHYRDLLKSSERPPKPKQINSRYVRLPDEIIIDDEWLYLFGWFVAEGFSSIEPGKSKYLSFSAHQKEEQIQRRIAKKLSCYGIKSAIYKKKNSKAIEMLAWSGELAMWFRDWFGHGARNKTIPPELMGISPEQARMFLNGYIDGDGYRRGNQVEWVTASGVLCYQLCQLAIRAGHIPTIHRGSAKSGNHWVGGYTVGGKPGRNQEQDDNYIYRPIRKVETYFDKIRVYDLTVEDDRSFTTGFSTVHNCHRIGQAESVLVQHLVFDESLDADMAKSLVAKQAVIDQALDDGIPDLEVSAAPASTEYVSRRALEKEAEKITDEQVAVVHETLRMLSKMCDGARSLDGSGFSRADVRVGHSLAEESRLTKKQAALGMKICIKYKRQYDDARLAKILGNAP